MHTKHRYSFNALLVILNLFSFAGFTQSPDNDYREQWRKVEAFEKDGLTMSAISQVNAIYELAKKDNNQPQIIKSLLYKIKLSENITEDATKKMIDTLQQEMAISPQPAKSILQTITAQLYQNYLAFNRYRLYSVSNTVSFQKDDIATWSVKELQSKIASLYESSLDYDGLKKIETASYSAIIAKGNTPDLRPTLFDLLAHRALEFFKSSENDVNRPAYAFEITDTKVFAPAEEFVKVTFESEDTNSLHLKALKIYQRLIAFHLNDVRPLIDVDLARLAFVYRYAVSPGKNRLYILALKNIYDRYDDKSVAQAGYLAAHQMSVDASDNPNNTGVTMIQVVELLEAVVGRFPGSPGAIEARNELAVIRNPSLSVVTEKVNSIGEPFRALVSFKNTDGVFLRAIAISKKQQQDILKSGTWEQQFRQMRGLPFVKEWHQPLPDTKDYLQHSAEIRIDGLPAGEYLILASLNKNFSPRKNAMSANFIYVSNISFVNNGKDYFVLDRETGAPIAAATIHIFQREYDYQKRKYDLTNLGNARSNENGFFTIPRNRPNQYYNLLLDISTAHDRLFLDEELGVYNYNSVSGENLETQAEVDQVKATIFFFTDRSIYRPGQTVYYKGIGVTQGLKSKKSELLKTSAPLKILLINANGEKIDSTNVTLNEYGSFSGRFALPQNQLTGAFRIRCEDIPRGDVSFSVEEYKRPKFFAEFEKLQETYRINDTVHITGKAEAYAGNRIDGAAVSYRVTRVARFIYPWRLWRFGLPHVAPLEITHGKTMTDEHGNFQINFKAIPDLKVAPSAEPVFDYRVTADITDINGETRSAAITVPVGYKALNLQIAIQDRSTIIGVSPGGVSVTAQNLSGEPQSVSARVKIYRLHTPDRILRERFWQEPDTFVMTKNDYIRSFPNDIYKDENNPASWDAVENILDKTDSVNGMSKIKIDNPLTTGWYRIEASSHDRFGNEVKDVKYFRVIHPDDPRTLIPEYVVNATGGAYQPGDTASVVVSAPDDIFLIQQLDSTQAGKANSQFQFYKLNKQVQTYHFNIGENDRGGFGVMNFFVRHNRLYYTKSVINVPWSNKELDITFDTYREKTLPGSQETWKVTIAGDKGGKVAAEMLASMYDASLDQFEPHSWNQMDIWPTYSSATHWNAGGNFTSVNSRNVALEINYLTVPRKTYDRIVPLPEGWYGDVVVTAMGVSKRGRPQSVRFNNKEVADKIMAAPSVAVDAEVNDGIASDSSTVAAVTLPEETQSQEVTPPLRTNFNETAFFYPDLKTDEKGNISFSFTMPEALTTWRLMAQAHTKELAIGYAEKSVITQKDLMVIPNPPRFFREGDKIAFSAKVVNMTDKDMVATVVFHLLNAATMLPVDGWFQNTITQKQVTVPGRQSTAVFFSIDIPKGFNDVVVYQISATAGAQSDGEQAYVPVVTNRMLVTESMPIEMKQNGTKSFSFEKLLESGNSATLTNYGLTVEYTPNPAWYAVQALPYLNDYPYECTEQVFNRYFANALAMSIANSSPKLKAVFEQWKKADTSALLSNLQKNQELKSVLLEETPWVLSASSEAQQKKNIALLFDIVHMTSQLDGAIKTVKERQSSNGGFVWFKGGPDDRYMTQYIVADIGHLKKLGAWPATDNTDLNTIVHKAIPYLDDRITDDYKELKKTEILSGKDHLSRMAIHYLYTRSFFPEIPVATSARTAYNYYIGQAKKYWLQSDTYSQGMIALILYRLGDIKMANAITKSLKENAITDETMGMYWKAWNQRGWFWYQAPIESQSLMIEVFTEVSKDVRAVAELKTWLLKNKQTNNWQTTKATAEAVYALLLQGEDWLSQNKEIRIKLGNTTISSNNEKQEAGTGYFQRKIDGTKVSPDMGNVTVSVSQPGVKDNNSSPSWGAVYWQYFEDLDKITFAETPLKIFRKLFVETNTDQGPILTPVNNGAELAVGDKIKVRIELRVDRDMEYVHMKDMRASTMEPVNVLSQYKWQGGLGYYESTKDASTNFFFNYLPKGTWIFEYSLFVSQSGDFSNGITTAQCMYAPEFTAHSEGVRVKVK